MTFRYGYVCCVLPNIIWNKSMKATDITDAMNTGDTVEDTHTHTRVRERFLVFFLSFL